MPTVDFRTRIEAPRAALYTWHARPSAFERLAPPGGSVRLVEDSGGIEDGARKVIALGPLGIRWVAVHDQHVAGRRFRDVQEHGPFRRFEHTHDFLDAGAHASTLADHIEYELPFGRLGALVAGRVIAGQLTRMFERRHRVTKHDVELFAREPAPSISIDVRGNSSDIRVLSAYLSTGGWNVVPSAARIVRVTGGRLLLDGRDLAPFLDAEDPTLGDAHRELRAALST